MSVKQVKVDNWGIFFLQRLQKFFLKNEYCDLILRFNGKETVQVHWLVVNACTEYFQVLEKNKSKDSNCIELPPDLQPDVVLPIINFMYTGRLEFNSEIQHRLYATARRMNMTVLTKLLDAQNLTTSNNGVGSNKPRRPNIFPSHNTSRRPLNRQHPDLNLPEPLPGRKLPIWKRRNIPVMVTPTTVEIPEGSSRHAVIDEVPRPTRFEIPDEGDEPTISFDSTFDDITYESKPLVKPPLKKSMTGSSVNISKNGSTSQSKRQISFEELRQSTNSFPIKRMAVSSEPQPKKPRVLDDQQVQAAQELLKEQSARKLVTESEDEFEDDVDNDLDTTEMSNLEYPENEEDLISQENVPQKSCLKAQGTEVTPKKVRFSIDGEEKENSGQTSTPTSTNHAKIISEVLKKYPHLVKSNKNIKLKILQKGSSSISTTQLPKDEEIKSKISYVVLKNDPLSKQSTLKSGDSSPPLGAENTTGPWICHPCGTNGKPLELESYYQYRRHLQDVHMEKFDSRICEHCGYKASKRNLLLYHLCIKHGIAPPRNCQFPKCDQCDYIALSESLLIKHRNNHANSKEFTCKVCRASFKSNGALQGHTQANLHSDQSKRLYECPHCQKPFVRNINLKAHIRTSHKDKRDEDEEETLDLPVLDASNIEYILPDLGNPEGESILSDHDYAEQGITTVTEIQYLEMDPSRPPPTTQYIAGPVNENAQFYSHDGQQFLVQNSGFEGHARLVEFQQGPETLRIHEIRNNIPNADVIHVVTEDQIRAMESDQSVHLMVTNDNSTTLSLDQNNIETITLNESELENMIVSDEHLQPIIIPNDQIQTIAINNDGIETIQLSEEQLHALSVTSGQLEHEDLEQIILNQHDLTLEPNQIRSISIHSEKEENKLVSLDSIKQSIKAQESSQYSELDKLKILNITSDNTISIGIPKPNNNLKKSPMKKIDTSLISKSLEETKKLITKDNPSVHNIHLNMESDLSKDLSPNQDIIIPNNISTSSTCSFSEIKEKSNLINKSSSAKDEEEKIIDPKSSSFHKEVIKLEPSIDTTENVSSLGQHNIQMASLISNDWSDDEN